MALLATIQNEEERYGSSLVGQVLDGIAYDREVAHYPEACMFCMIDGFGNWDYCPRSRCQGHSIPTALSAKATP